jgi:hypothetical protein
MRRRALVLMLLPYLLLTYLAYSKGNAAWAAGLLVGALVIWGLNEWMRSR